MAIGNPISLTSNVATKTINVIATASQTSFTVTGGYRLNELSVFRNGVRLVNGRDFTARDGFTATLLSAASEGDVLEFQVFDTFRVADAITPFDSAQTIAGDLSIVGVLSATQLGSVNFNLTSGIQTFHDVRVGGALTVAGTLTYEDTTNTNTTGIATFSGGMNISGVGATVTTLNVTGFSTFASNVSIADSIFHTGDTDTSIRFPAADTFTVETAGVERVRVTSAGNMGLGTNNPADALHIKRTSGAAAIRIQSQDGVQASVVFGDITDDSRGRILYSNNNEAMQFEVNNLQEAMRIDSSGRLLLGTATEGEASADDLTIATSGSTGITIRSGTSNSGNLFFSDGTSGNDEIRGYVQYLHASNDLLLGTNASERLRITSAGNVSIQNDSGKFTAGAGDDLQIFHNATDSVITDSSRNLLVRSEGSGDLFLQSDTQVILGDVGGNETFIECNDNSDVKLFHDNSEKLATTSTGVTVTGTLNATTAITQNGNALATGGKAIAMALIFG